LDDEKRKGIEYNLRSGNLEFEGKYLNNKKWNGKVKEYDYYGEKLVFEVEYLNGKKHIKEYYENAKIKFEDEYLNG